MSGVSTGGWWGVAVSVAVLLASGRGRPEAAVSKPPAETVQREPAPQRGETLPEELWLRVTTSASAVEFGATFELTVERGWDRALRTEDWNDDVLAPLDLTLVDASRRDGERQVEEIRRYRARLFRAGEVLVAAPWFRARSADGEMRITFADDLAFDVSSALDSAAPGPVELPSELMPAPFSWRRWAVPLAAFAAAGLGLGLFVRRRLVRRATARAAVRVPAGERALARLSGLGAVEPEDRAGHRAFCVEAAAILRDYIDERFDLGSRVRTTEELLGATTFVDACGLDARRQAGEVLARCDFVKFAFGAVDGSQRAAILGAIEEFVRATPAPEPEITRR